jgi:hypothetical protein
MRLVQRGAGAELQLLLGQGDCNINAQAVNTGNGCISTSRPWWALLGRLLSLVHTMHFPAIYSVLHHKTIPHESRVQHHAMLRLQVTLPCTLPAAALDQTWG